MFMVTVMSTAISFRNNLIQSRVIDNGFLSNLILVIDVKHNLNFICIIVRPYNLTNNIPDRCA